MCFRPAEVSNDKKCPQCGTSNDMTASVCKECGADLPTAPSMPSVPGAPGAPAAPGAPGMPIAPGAPGVPKAPGTPGEADIKS